jgi:2-dehydropantoate 2-reductase
MISVLNPEALAGAWGSARHPRRDLVVGAGAVGGYFGAPNILQEMWEKWIFIATLDGITCLLRGTTDRISTDNFR